MNEKFNPYGNETTYTLAKVWLETHSYKEVIENSEYNWLEFHLGVSRALDWIEMYLELTSDEEIKKGIEEYEQRRIYSKEK